MTRDDFARALARHGAAMNVIARLDDEIAAQETEREEIEARAHGLEREIGEFLEQVESNTYLQFADYVYWVDATDGLCFEKLWSYTTVPLRVELTPVQQTAFEALLRGEDECGSTPLPITLGSLPDLFAVAEAVDTELDTRFASKLQARRKEAAS